MGVLQLKGHVVLQDIPLQGEDEEGIFVNATAGEAYFVISEFKDTNVEKLPYLTIIE
jgi:hypothetical protein